MYGKLYADVLQRFCSMTYERIVICVFILYSSLNAQGVVKNSGFEEYISFNENNTSPVDGWLGGAGVPAGWYSASSTSFPTYFNKSSKIPHYRIKNTDFSPNSGSGCIGMCLYRNDADASRDFVFAPLNTPLKSGALYCVSFFISYCKFVSAMTATSVGLVFSSKSFETASDISKLSLNPQISASEELLQDTGWKEVRGLYRANGAEQFVTIGNFKTYEIAGKRRQGAPVADTVTGFVIYFPSAYYFIDDLSIIPIENEFECAIFGMSAVLNNIFFVSGGSTLLPGAFPTLNNLASYLKQNKDLKVELVGHTDSLGDSVTNQKLSENRARSVKNYLISMGISRTRISTKGFGGDYPIASNSSEVGRIKNRRVEYVLYKK